MIPVAETIRLGKDFKCSVPCPTCGAESDERCFSRVSMKSLGDVIHSPRADRLHGRLRIPLWPHGKSE